MHRLGAVWRAVALAAAVVVGGAGCGGPAASSPQPENSPSAAPPPGSATQSDAVPAGRTPSVGVLVSGDSHFCTASVVDSPRGNVIATAAHCTNDFGSGTLEFAPGFTGAAKGSYPYGKWKVRAVQVDDRWTSDQDDSVDYAFLTVDPDAQGRSVQSVVGASTPDWGAGPDQRVTVVGYPLEDHNPQNRPIACTTDVHRDPDLAAMLLMHCGGFWEGTSGSPWLVGYQGPDRLGRIIGVLSGGDTDVESTAVLFDAKARSLYERATQA
ncbi:serine protease [Streptomyces sp. SDr-06]|uniref:trypsin-like serine peptidase n=1 Tax=Streptomyces sp. SDr-06 TaxID=2267702 RepID=UPI000DEB9F54|nr:trypsin-like serine protease [Streptomyces sp. SDr-06]RCH61689.1 serine protease [Streptomyces sp. SDr-06]